MAIRRLSTVVDHDGVTGQLHQITLDAAHKPIARVRLGDGSHVKVPFELFEHADHGGYRVRARWRDFVVRDETGTTVPIVEERVRVDVRAAPEQRLRIRRRVVSESQVVETPFWHERIDVERVPVDQLVDQVPAARREGDVLIIPRVEEIVVVEKRLRVREELRIRVVREQRTHRETVELRHHELDFESADQPQSIQATKRRRRGA